MHISRRKREGEAVAGVPERKKRREWQSYWRERCASQVWAGRPLPEATTKTRRGAAQSTLRPADEESHRRPTSEHSAQWILSNRGRFM